MIVSAICIDDLVNIGLWVKVVEYAQNKNVTTCFAANTNDLTASESAILKEFSVLGHEVCSHTVSHLWDYRKLPDDVLNYELSESKKVLESVIGKEVTTIVWPQGFADDRIAEVAKSVGYTAGRIVTVPKGASCLRGANPFLIPGFLASRLFNKNGRMVRPLRRETVNVFFGHGEDDFNFLGWRRLIDFLISVNLRPIHLSDIGNLINDSSNNS